ncbi:MAG: 2-oxoacid:ferredoxin oxidoreductase subunit beta [Rhodospirillaceae bacterium]|nr:2-oxoacid:ferredoxin oxidoreductase subunit beta [Magnetovibrio sp.]MAY66528.1 2-oxoacid:ferredoxin oxidoreductase subunit beta [Rhodospirillaceae bacterium]
MNVVNPDIAAPDTDATPELTARDFTTDQEVRWCPGCGDYAILKAVRGVLAEAGRHPDDVVFISGIGCAARFPYYLASYGFHTIHGRAPAVATGVKMANPDLDVWVVGGDGDFLSIGGNHLMHALRRNVDLNLIMPNNAVYGLTKGQYSPASATGMRSPSSPGGSVEAPVNAALLALGAGGRFVARSADTLQDHLPGVLKAAQANKGASFVEILQNCVVFNDGAFEAVRDKGLTADRTLRLEHGKPMVFGKDQDKGISIDWQTGIAHVVPVGSGNPAPDIAIHDQTNLALATILARMDAPDLPLVIGVLYHAPAEEFTNLRGDSSGTAINRQALLKILSAGKTWQVA